MATTIKDICDEYGISRSTALRRVKECFAGRDDAPKPNEAVRLDASQTHVFADYMGKRHESKTRQDAPNSADVTRQDASSKDVEIARLQAENDGLKREIQLLSDRLEKADEALEREQMSGFWSRLGQKLLGKGGA